MRFLPAILALGSGAALFGVASPKEQGDEVTFNRDIAPIIFAKCLPCHREGGSGPFSLATYADVKRRSLLIRQVALVGTMPPTDAESDLGRLAMHPPLTSQESILLQAWQRQGLKEGEPRHLPEAPRESGPWRLGEPDLVLKSGPVRIAGEGAPGRRRVVIPLNLTENRRLVGFEVRPATGGPFRFIRLAVQEPKSPDPFAPTGADLSLLIGSWAPGYYPWRLPAGHGIELKQRDSLLAEVLYQPSGKPEDGSFEVALYFGTSNTVAPRWQTFGTKEFELGIEELVELKSEMTLDQDIDVIALYPELRFFARQVRIVAQEPGEAPKTLMLVLTYDPYWLGSYVFEKPVRLRRGTKLTTYVQYDNTSHAFGDRDRPIYKVRFGPTEKDETFWVHMQYVPVLEDK